MLYRHDKLQVFSTLQARGMTSSIPFSLPRTITTTPEDTTHKIYEQRNLACFHPTMPAIAGLKLRVEADGDGMPCYGGMC